MLPSSSLMLAPRVWRIQRSPPTLQPWATGPRLCERWMPQRHLQLAIASAKARLVQAARPWLTVYGPAAAFVASAAFLKWHVQDAAYCTTDIGRRLRFEVDPPAVIKWEIAEAVRRWRWRNLGSRHASLGIGRKRPCSPHAANLEVAELEVPVG